MTWIQNKLDFDYSIKNGKIQVSTIDFGNFGSKVPKQFIKSFYSCSDLSINIGIKFKAIIQLS